MKLTEQEKEVLMKIGEFFYAECGEDLKKTTERLYNLRIKQVIVAGTTVLIETSRPGLLIGKRGSTIDGLKKCLGMDIHIREYEGDELEQFMLSGIIVEY
jgi:ribosomal protein S3